jgi:hypothetical protein
MPWKSIDTAPKDGTPVICWAKGWIKPTQLMWHTNYRIVEARKRDPSSVGDMVDSYFGDLVELDDYDLAKPGNGPTHWHPLDPLPA